MLLTQDGIRALEGFVLTAAPDYDEDFNRVEGNDGLILTCTAKHHASGQKTRWHWPGHVAAPNLRDLVLVAQQHWNAAHREAATVPAETQGAP